MFGGDSTSLISYVHTHSIRRFMTLAPAADRRGYLITNPPPALLFLLCSPFPSPSLQPERPSGPVTFPARTMWMSQSPSRPRSAPTTTPASILTWLQLRGGPKSSYRRHFHFLKLIFIETLPNISAVTVSTHWHNDLLGRETLLADIVGSLIHSWPIFSLSSRKVNPLLLFTPPYAFCSIFT